MYAIKTDKLCKYYNKSRGIESVTLSVEEGDFFGFIGPNGSGKSTTVRTLLGLIKKTSGEGQVLGLDIEKDKNEILKAVGYMPSEATFYSGMRVSEIIELSAALRGKDCKSEAARLCERLCLDTRKKVGELSLGNRKKVGIVCAMQHRPSLYILDEPTSGLDPLMQREFFSILEERNREGATIFLSTHILSEVARYARNAAIIRDGEILVQKSVSDLSHTGIKEVTLKGVSENIKIAGARDLKIDGECAKFLFSGTPTDLMDTLRSLSFYDMNVTDPDLEDVFMHYYTKEEA